VAKVAGALSLLSSLRRAATAACPFLTGLLETQHTDAHHPCVLTRRPYFTIHDPDFIALAAGRLPKRTRYQEVLPAAASQQQQEQSAGVAAAAAAGDGGDVQAPGQAAAEAGKQQQQEQQPGSAAASKERAARAAAAAAADAALRGDLPVLLGVTNVFFVKALPKWPNVVAVSRKDPTSAAAAAAAAAASSSRSGSPSKVAVSSEGGAAAAAGNEAAGGPAAAAAVSAGGAGSSISSGGSPVPPAASGRFGSGLFSATAAAAVRALQRRHQGPQHLLSHFAPHLWTAAQHVQYIKPDHALLSKARAAIEPAVGASPAAAAAAAAASAGGGSLAAVGAPAATAAARLRRHFAELTAGLLAPFDPYFTPGPDGTVRPALMAGSASLLARERCRPGARCSHTCLLLLACSSPASFRPPDDVMQCRCQPGGRTRSSRPWTPLPCRPR
jgi:hypothetical protein